MVKQELPASEDGPEGVLQGFPTRCRGGACLLQEPGHLPQLGLRRLAAQGQDEGPLHHLGVGRVLGQPRVQLALRRPQLVVECLPAAILEEEGIEVDLAADGIEALAAVERRLPHAILLDVMMPRLDGFEVCRRLKGRRPSCFVPIILLTALADTESKIRGLESGADDFLNKPFHRSELLTRLDSLLRIRALRDELDSTESVIYTMIELLEGRGGARTQHHSLRVAALASATARRLELKPRLLRGS